MADSGDKLVLVLLRQMRAEIDGMRGEMRDVRGEVRDMRGEMSVRFDALETRIDLLDGRLTAQTEQFNGRFTGVETAIVELGARVHVMSSQLQRLNDRVTRLEVHPEPTAP